MVNNVEEPRASRTDRTDTHASCKSFICYRVVTEEDLMVETSYEPMYYTYKHTCRHTYAQTRVHMHLGMRTRMDTHIQDTLCTDMTTYTHHTHTCTHTHTHTHTQRSLRNLSNDTQRLPIDQLPHLCTVYPCHVTSLVTTVMGSAPSMTFLW